MQNLEGQKQTFQKELEEIREIKEEHEEVRQQIEDGNRLYLQEVK